MNRKEIESKQLDRCIPACRAERRRGAGGRSWPAARAFSPGGAGELLAESAELLYNERKLRKGDLRHVQRPAFRFFPRRHCRKRSVLPYAGDRGRLVADRRRPVSGDPARRCDGTPLCFPAPGRSSTPSGGLILTWIPTMRPSGPAASNGTPTCRRPAATAPGCAFCAQDPWEDARQLHHLPAQKHPGHPPRRRGTLPGLRRPPRPGAGGAPGFPHPGGAGVRRAGPAGGMRARLPGPAMSMTRPAAFTAANWTWRRWPTGPPINCGKH